jgi:hypothetical protein
MAVNFGLLQQAAPVSAFFQGQQDIRAEQDRNALRQQQAQQLAMQQENALALRESRMALADERRAAAAKAAESQGWLSKVTALFESNNMPLNLQTARQGQLYAIRSGNKEAVEMMNKTVQALEEREALAAAFGPQAVAPGAAPAVAPAVAPTNALVAPPQAPAPAVAPAAGVSRERLQAIIADPNAPKAVVDRAKVLLTTLPKEPSAPTAIQEFEAFQKMTPEQQAAYLAHRTALQPKPAQTTIKLPEQEKAERGERGKLLVKEYEGISNAARLAGRTLPALETQERILDSGFKTGFGTEAQKAGASVLAALGVPEANKFATDAQTFLSATQQAVLQRQLEQKGPQTEADAQRITQTGAQFGNTPAANKFIVSVAKAQLKRDIEQRNFYDAWWKKNSTYDGAEDAWFNGEGGKSLFDRPELKQYAAPAKPAAAPAASPSGTQPYSDVEKERRYQEWKRKQQGTP